MFSLACVCSRERVCMPGPRSPGGMPGTPPEGIPPPSLEVVATEACGTHPTGMLSC